MAKTGKQTAVGKNKKKGDDSSTETQSESENSSSENEMDFDVNTTSGGKAKAKKGAKEVVSKEAVAAGKKPAKGSKHEVRRVAGTFEGDMREGVPIEDSRPGKKTYTCWEEKEGQQKGTQTSEKFERGCG